MAYTDEFGNIWTNPDDIAQFSAGGGGSFFDYPAPTTDSFAPYIAAGSGPTYLDFPSIRDIAASVLPAIASTLSAPATYQRTTPSAPLLGGACPPGRVLRRVSLGRDKCIKKPHMNVCNRHALARSTRRVSGFLHMAKNTEKKMRQSFGGLLTTKSRSRSGGRGRCVGCGQTSARCAC